MEFSKIAATIAASTSDHHGDTPSSIGAVIKRATSNPRKRLVISPGGKAPAWVAIIGAPKSTPFAWVQRIAASSPADPVATAISTASDKLRREPSSPKPAKAGATDTDQIATTIAGTVMDASLILASEKGKHRASPPVLVRTRRPPSKGMVAPNNARAAKTEASLPMPSASAAYGTTVVAPTTSSGWGNRRSRCHSRQMIASSPSPRPRTGFTWPISIARRATTMSRASPTSRAKNAPEIPLTSAPPPSRRVRWIRPSRIRATAKLATGTAQLGPIRRDADDQHQRGNGQHTEQIGEDPG